jgi:hypothetical protein
LRRDQRSTGQASGQVVLLTLSRDGSLRYLQSDELTTASAGVDFDFCVGSIEVSYGCQADRSGSCVPLEGEDREIPA